MAKTSQNSKSFILIRHAHRDTSDRGTDNGIDDKGKTQVMKLLKEKSLESPSKPLLALSSPKKRCVQTIQPLTEKWDVELKIHPALDEQHHDELSKVFLERIEEFVSQVILLPVATVAICSHGDWIPEAISLMAPRGVAASFTGNLSKGEFLIFNFIDGKWELKR